VTVAQQCVAAGLRHPCRKRLPSSINVGSRCIITWLANVFRFDQGRRRPHNPLADHSEVNGPPRKPFQFSLKRLLVGVAVVAVLLTAVLFVRRVIQVPFDAYQNWAMGDLVIGYMEANDGAWPGSWDDLRTTYNQLGGRLPGGETIESLQRDVHVDFEFDPVAASASITADASEPGFRVIRLKNGSTAHYEGDEPNQRVFDFLKSKKFGGG